MLDVLLATDVKRQDAQAEARGVPVEQLMENAGFAVARAARALLGGCYGRRVVVVCGKGNNGGDGLVAARVLHRWGAHATAVLLWDDLSGLPGEQRARFRGPVRPAADLARALRDADLVIDAIFGVGLTRAPEGPAAAAIQAVNDSDAPILAVDVPSGIDADTGAIPGLAVEADATVTFGGQKPGLLFMPGAAYAGHVEVADIGLPPGLEATARALAAADVREQLPVRALGTNKRRVGTLLVVAGSRAMPGAAGLVCGAAIHAGAGLTTLLAPEDVCRVVLARIPEMTTIPAPESAEGTLDPKALDLLRPRLGEFHAIALGPGLTTHPATVEAVRALLAETDLPVVADADGLNAYAGAVDELASRRGTTIVTPHAGELSRLLDRSAGELEADRLGTARAAAERLNAIVVFKGQGTVIASPDGELLVNMTGSEALAQGGTGDVLTGLLGSLAAQRRERVDGALVAAGVWVHGRAGDRISARAWPHPANASTLLYEIGPTVRGVMTGA